MSTLFSLFTQNHFIRQGLFYLGLLRAFGAPASLRSASVGAKRVPLARSALPVFAIRTTVFLAHTG